MTKQMLVVAALGLTLGLAGCVTGPINPNAGDEAIRVLCAAQPQLEVCKLLATPTPRPTVTPTGAPTPTMTPTATPGPTSTPAPTSTPTPTMTPAAPTPTPVCIPRPGPQPVSIAWPKRCPAWAQDVSYLGDGTDGTVAPPRGYATMCGLARTCGGWDGKRPDPNGCTWWMIGDGLHKGMQVVNVHGAWLQQQILGTSQVICVDMYGRRFDDCERLYETPQEPAGIAEYHNGGYPVPTFCGDPTPAPQPTDPSTGPPPTASDACVLPPGDGNGVDCPREGRGAHLSAVEAAIGLVREHRAEWFTDDGSSVRPGRENPFRWDVVQELRARGLCAFFDGEEIAVKASNDFSEQFHILASDGRVRTGEQSYRATCRPAWSAVPATDVDRPPALSKLKAGDHCSNSKESPRYRRGECLVDMSDVFRDPEHLDDNTRDSPCDPLHFGWTTFCHQSDWADQRGGLVEVQGATFAGPDGGNPYFSVITGWTAGQPFKFCVRPRPDRASPILDSGPDCKQVTP